MAHPGGGQSCSPNGQVAHHLGGGRVASSTAVFQGGIGEAWLVYGVTTHSAFLGGGVRPIPPNSCGGVWCGLKTPRRSRAIRHSPPLPVVPYPDFSTSVNESQGHVLSGPLPESCPQIGFFTLTRM